MAFIQEEMIQYPSDHNVPSHSNANYADTGGEGSRGRETEEQNGIPGGDDSVTKSSRNDRVAQFPKRGREVRTHRQSRRQPRRDARARDVDGPRGVVPDGAGLHPHNRVAGSEEGGTDMGRDRERRRRRIQQARLRLEAWTRPRCLSRSGRARVPVHAGSTATTAGSPGAVRLAAAGLRAYQGQRDPDSRICR